MRYASPKRLLFVISSFYGGGAEMVLVHMINYLHRKRYAMELVVFDNFLDYCQLIPKDVSVHCLHKKNRMDFVRLVKDLRTIIRRIRPDVVFSLMFYTNVLTVLSSRWVGKRFRLILCEHIYLPTFLQAGTFSSLKSKIVPYTYNRADWVVGVSKSIRTSLVRDFKVNPLKTVTIYNPIPLEDIRKKAEAAVEHPFLSGDYTVLLSAGRLKPQKRFDRLLKAFGTVARQRSNTVLLIMGEGTLRFELENLSRELGIRDRVDFVGFQRNPFAWMSKADLFVLSSDFEGLPMTLLEAMACGVPVVSTDCPSGPAEIIIENENGLLSPLDDGALAATILELLNDPARLKRFQSGALRRSADFGIEKAMAQYEALIGS